jgi:hypothetical protein
MKLVKEALVMLLVMLRARNSGVVAYLKLVEGAADAA